MIILSNVQKLYDGTSATAEAIQERMDVCVDGVLINLALLKTFLERRESRSLHTIILCFQSK